MPGARGDRVGGKIVTSRDGPSSARAREEAGTAGGEILKGRDGAVDGQGVETGVVGPEAGHPHRVRVALQAGRGGAAEGVLVLGGGVGCVAVVLLGVLSGVEAWRRGQRGRFGDWLLLDEQVVLHVRRIEERVEAWLCGTEKEARTEISHKCCSSWAVSTWGKKVARTHAHSHTPGAGAPRQRRVSIRASHIDTTLWKTGSSVHVRAGLVAPDQGSRPPWLTSTHIHAPGTTLLVDDAQTGLVASRESPPRTAIAREPEHRVGAKQRAKRAQPKPGRRLARYVATVDRRAAAARAPRISSEQCHAVGRVARRTLRSPHRLFQRDWGPVPGQTSRSLHVDARRRRARRTHAPNRPPFPPSSREHAIANLLYDNQATRHPYQAWLTGYALFAHCWNRWSPFRSSFLPNFSVHFLGHRFVRTSILITLLCCSSA